MFQWLRELLVAAFSVVVFVFPAKMQLSTGYVTSIPALAENILNAVYNYFCGYQRTKGGNIDPKSVKKQTNDKK